MAVQPASDRAERIEARLSALPQSPGVYLFRSAAGDVLYVGKAKSLRSRVRSYFRREAYASEHRSANSPGGATRTYIKM